MPKILQFCKECGCPFQTLQTEVNRGYGKFCGLSCSAKFRNRNREYRKPKSWVQLTCQHCGRSYRKLASHLKKMRRCGYSSKYCSRECLNKSKRKYATFICEQCKIQIKAYGLGSKKRRFCSRRCWWDFMSANKKPRSLLTLRFQVLARDGFRCQYCGRSPQSDPSVVLHADHKIPESQGGKTTLENLIGACRECNLGKSDSLLDIYASASE